MDALERNDYDNTTDFDDRIELDDDHMEEEEEENEPLGEEEDFYRHLEEY